MAKQYNPKEELPVVVFDIEIDKRPVGRIEMTLRSDLVPKTAGAGGRSATIARVR